MFKEMDKDVITGRIAVVLSCEHGGNIVPDEFSELFRNASDVLESHRGLDPGALELLKIF